ncbi:hypothetical protein DL93DRAFT_2088322 [Clavulina sp. PMI_390]|nr:hypothetical protein DL93DRAFT_2088322 [Clavulina sp. PMI_390]
MQSPRDFSGLETILGGSQTLSHMTFFASVPDDLDPIHETTAKPSPWSQLTSLRIQGYHDNDSPTLAPYLESMHGLDIQTLELVDIDNGVFRTVLTEMPSNIRLCVKALLVIRGGHKMDLADYLEHLLATPPSPAESAPTEEHLPLPNMQSLVISGSRQTDSDVTHQGWTAPVELLMKVVGGRRGVLKHLILPAAIEPANTGSGSENIIPLTQDQLLGLQGSDPEKILETGFSWTIDNHGFNADPPDWS